MGHRFDNDEYSFDLIHISKLVMRSDSIPFFRRVVRMMRYLSRKLVLYINYLQRMQQYVLLLRCVPEAGLEEAQVDVSRQIKSGSSIHWFNLC